MPRPLLEIPNYFISPNATYAGFQRKLQALGGTTIPFTPSSKAQSNEFAVWKKTFASKINSRVEQEGDQVEQDGLYPRERRLLLWCAMGEQVKLVALEMQARIRKEESGDSEERSWSLADLFLHWSEVSSFRSVLFRARAVPCLCDFPCRAISRSATRSKNSQTHLPRIRKHFSKNS